MKNKLLLTLFMSSLFATIHEAAFAQREVPLDLPAGENGSVVRTAADGDYFAYAYSRTTASTFEGRILFYERENGDWRLKSDINLVGMPFGSEIKAATSGHQYLRDLAIDENIAALGVDLAGASGAGIYLFKRDPATGEWVNSHGRTSTQAGYGKSLDIKGDLLAVGVPDYTDTGSGMHGAGIRGFVSLYQLDEEGKTTWINNVWSRNKSYATPGFPNVPYQLERDRSFGHDVALFSDGDGNSFLITTAEFTISLVYPGHGTSELGSYPVFRVIDLNKSVNTSGAQVDWSDLGYTGNGAKINLDVENSFLAIQSWNEDDGKGAVSIYKISGGEIEKTKTFTSPVKNDGYGHRIRLMSFEPTGEDLHYYLAVSAYRDDRETGDASAYSNEGKVYLYKYKNNNWSELIDITPSNRIEGNEFGTELALSRSGLIALDNDGGSYFFDFAPAPPKLSVSDDNSAYQEQLNLKWEDGNASDVDQEFRTENYSLYDQSGGTIIAETNDLSYTAGSVDPGEIRSYSIRGRNKFGVSAPAYDVGRSIPLGKISGKVAAPEKNGGGGVGDVRIDMPVYGSSLELNVSGSGSKDENYLVAKNIAHFPEEAITAEFWAKPKEVHNKLFLSYASGSMDNAFLVAASNGKLWIYVAGQALVSDVEVPADVWNHYAVTWAKDGELKIYRNGKPEQTTTLASAQAIPAGGTLMVGQEQDCEGGCLDPVQSYIGLIDEVRIWNNVRNASQIDENKDAVLDPANHADEMAVYYRFDEGAGSESSMAYDMMATVRDDEGAPAFREGQTAFSADTPALRRFDVTKKDGTGSYTLDKINFDFSGADVNFTVTPYNDGNRGFDPESQTGILNSEDHDIVINFKDTSSFTIPGRIYFNLPAQEYAAKEITVYAYAGPNFQTMADSVVTDAEGKFAFTLQPGLYRFEPEYADHSFSESYYDVNIPGDLDSLLFENTTVRTVRGKFVGGSCDIDVGSATMDVKCCGGLTLENDIETQKIQDGVHSYEITVPALVKDSIEIAIASVDSDVFVFELAIQGDDGFLQTRQFVKVDSGNATVDFFYRADPQLKIEASDLTELECAPGLFLLEEGDNITLELEAQEVYVINSQELTCPLDTGAFAIFDAISDRADSVMYIEKADSTYQYVLHAGNPNLIGGGAHPYQKSLQIDLRVPLGKTATQTLWAVVTGSTERVGQPFISINPSNIPLMVLRDPPGDKSYSYLEKGATLTRNMQLSNGGSGKTSTKMDIGDKNTSPVFATTAMSLGFEGADTKSVEMSMTTKSRISTSAEGVPGHQSDLFMGTALNILYGINDILDYNPQTCEPSLRQSITWRPGSINSTYMLSYYDIKNTKIPELEMLLEAEQSEPEVDQVRIDSLDIAIEDWEKLIAFSDYTTNYMTAPEKENFEFAGNSGAYERSSTIEKTLTDSYFFTTTFDLEVEIGSNAVIPIPFSSPVNLGGFGLKVEAGYNYTESQSEGETDSYTVGYTLDDDDAGDLFLVEVATKLENNPEFDEKIKTIGQRLEETPLTNTTPSFRLIGGRSSAPYEGLPSVPRDTVQITVNPRTRVNVPEGEEAVFTLNVGNLSQSGETRDIAIRLLSESNPDGAIVTSGSGFLASGILLTSVPANESQTITFNVTRGPNAYRYENLRIVAYSPSEFEVYENLGTLALADTASFSVYFDAACKASDFFLPEQGWIVNEASNDSLKVILQDYDVNVTKTLDIQLRRKPSGSWTTLKTLSPEALTSEFSSQFINVKNLPDGNYELRAVTECEMGKNYSPVAEGTIDRQAPQVFGSPMPSDGVFSPDDIISVRFNENIDPTTVSPNSVTLINITTGDTLDLTMTQDERTILIEADEDFQMLENARLQVSVRDVADPYQNVTPPFNWSFVVNRNPVSWILPRTIEHMSEGEAFTFDAKLVNNGSDEVELNFSGLPSWMELLTTEDVIVPGESMFISFKIEEDAPLSAGRYEETIALETSSGQEKLDIILNVSCPKPDWEINPAAFERSMVVNAGIYAGAFPFAEPNDILAAFEGDELRGLVEVFNLIPNDEYAAFITIYGASDAGQEISFKLWDASECEILDIEETLTFESNGIVGSAQSLKKLTVGDAKYLTIPLDPGVNWISFNIEQANMSVNNIIKGVGLEDGDIISAMNGEYAQFASFEGWKGTLKTIEPGVTYKLRIGGNATLNVKGRPTTVKPEIIAGWNSYGFTGQNPQAVSDALSEYVASEGDMIRSQFSSATYAAGQWQGNLETLEPGEGYFLYSQNGASATFARINHSARVHQSADAGWTVNPASYANYMTVTGILELDGVQFSASGAVIGAFSGEECRGIAEPVQVMNTWMYFMTIYDNDEADSLTFKVFLQDENQTTELMQTMVFESERAKGKLRSPFTFSRVAGQFLEIENASPTSIDLSNASIAGGQPSGSGVGVFIAQDPNVGDNHTFALADGSGDDDNGRFTIQEAELLTAGPLTFDPQGDNLYSIRVQASDGRGGTVTRTFAIRAVNAANHAPTAIQLSRNQLLYGQNPGTTVGRLSSVDEDEFDDHAYRIVSVDNDASSSLFRIEGDLLKTNVVFTEDMLGEYEVTIASDDGNGGEVEQTFRIEVTDEVTGVGTPGENGFDIGAFAPNPARDSGSFSYRLPAGGAVSISVIDMTGKVWKQIEKEHAPGEYRLRLNLSDLPDGVYIYKLESTDGSGNGKIVKY